MKRIREIGIAWTFSFVFHIDRLPSLWGLINLNNLRAYFIFNHSYFKNKSLILNSPRNKTTPSLKIDWL